MCGITGIFDHRGLGLERLGHHAGAMADALAHRGPDGQGRFSDGPLGLGHRRLAILDLSERGAQPMTDPSGRFALVLNGEIYNHLELRARLGEPDGGWRSTSDTETLLAALMAWGPQRALAEARGMFALGYWDGPARTLTLARDRFGEKPLYYGTIRAEGGEALVFASQLAALRAAPGFDRTLDREALALYLRFSYVPEPRSICSDARKLPPGHLLVVRQDESAAPLPEPRPWWSLREEMDAAAPFTGTEEEAVVELERLLTASVARQLLSDRPLGALLSGGIDSSLVAALMHRAAGGPVRTFTIGFENPAWDESAQALAVAEHLGTEHTTLTVTPTEALGLVRELPRIWDEPFADPSQLPTALVCRLTREHVTVALSGDGGDELLAGYNRHAYGPMLWDKFRRVPRPLRAGVGRVLSILSPDSFDKIAHQLGATARLPGQKLAKLARVMGAPTRTEFYKGLTSTWPDPASLLADTSEPQTLLDDPAAWPENNHFTHLMQFLDTATYLPGDVLAKVDRAAMAFGLETRAPFLDPEVARFAWSLPMHLRISDGQGKHLARELLFRHVPRELVDRPKMGFGVPLGDWLRGPLREWSEDLLSRERLTRQGLLAPGPVRNAFGRLVRGGRSEEQFRVWNALMLQAWIEEWT